MIILGTEGYLDPCVVNRRTARFSDGALALFSGTLLFGNTRTSRRHLVLLEFYSLYLASIVESFEPPVLGVVRGLVAVYALLGILTYSFALAASAVNTIEDLRDSSGYTVQRTVIPSTLAMTFRIVTVSGIQVFHTAVPVFTVGLQATEWSVTNNKTNTINFAVEVDNGESNYINSSSTGIPVYGPSNTTHADVIYTFNSSSGFDDDNPLLYAPPCGKLNMTLVSSRAQGNLKLFALDCIIYPGLYIQYT